MFIYKLKKIIYITIVGRVLANATPEQDGLNYRVEQSRFWTLSDKVDTHLLFMTMGPCYSLKLDELPRTVIDVPTHIY